MRFLQSVNRVAPGVALCVAIALAAFALQTAQQALFGRSSIEPVVTAIILGSAARLVLRLGDRCTPGIAFSAKILLEVAVMLLGASISLQSLIAAGPKLVISIVVTVILSLFLGYAIGWVFRIPARSSLLIACGNSICGNSAIVSVAAVINSEFAETASAVAITALVGVIMVLALPLIVPAIGLSHTQYGVLAGMTVYSVPQVLAATAPVSSVSVQIGTLVKLVRVLMLGPLVLLLSVGRAVLGFVPNQPSAPAARWFSPRVLFVRFVPWFIVAFALMAMLRASNLLPSPFLMAAETSSRLLTVVSMAALGLSVDVTVVARTGLRQVAAVTISVGLLIGISLVVIHVIGVI